MFMPRLLPEPRPPRARSRARRRSAVVSGHRRRHRPGSTHRCSRRGPRRSRGRSQDQGRPRRPGIPSRLVRTGRTRAAGFRVESRFHDRRWRAPADSSSTSADIVISAPGGENLAAFSSRLHRTRSISTASIATSGRSGDSATRTGFARRDWPTTWILAPMTSSIGCHSRRSGALPACSRAMSSRFVTMPCRCIAWSLIAAAVSRSVSARAGTAPARESARPYSAVSGVRMSCEIADRSELRRRSDWISSWVRCATSTKCRRSSAMAASEATASSKGRSNASPASVGVRRDGLAVTSSTPRQRVEPASGRSKRSPSEAPISREAMPSRLWNTALALSRSVMVNAGTGVSSLALERRAGIRARPAAETRLHRLRAGR